MFRLFNCLFTIGQLAMAAVLLSQAPGALAFAPSLNSASRTRYVSVIPQPQQAYTTTATESSSSSALYMSEQNEPQKSSLPVLLDPGTKGGAVVLSLILFIIPIIMYSVATGPMGMDEIEVGRNIGVGFTVFTTVLWGASYIFRVATKDMTYAKQLKDYEDAVIAKRLEELDEDEVQALVEDIERDEF